jgi:hypothetical protein
MVDVIYTLKTANFKKKGSAAQSYEAGIPPLPT